MTALGERHGWRGSGLFVVAAMEREFSLLKKKLEGPTGVTFHTLGVGASRSYAEIRSMLRADLKDASNSDPSRQQAGAVLLLGFAGAVDDSLKPGDLILSSRYYRDDSSQTASNLDSSTSQTRCSEGTSSQSSRPAFLEPDPWMLQQAIDTAQKNGLRFTGSPSLTVGWVISSADRKRAIFEKYPVASVNMEDHWAAMAAQEAGVPFLSARAVLDPANQGLPRYLPSPSASGLETALSIFARPWRIGRLLNLAIQMRRAQSSLARFTISFIPIMADLASLPCLNPSSENPSSDIAGTGLPPQSIQSPAATAELARGLSR